MRLKSLDRLRGHPLFMSAHLRAGAASRTEYASGAAGDCPQSMESAVLRAFEDASRTREGCFWHRISLKMRRVPQEAFLSTARIFRTPYRMPTEAF